jgi:general secretion pathway protein A
MMEIIIEGYSDAIGNASYNIKVSQFRANIVKSYFVGKGCNPLKIKTVGMGPKNPIASNSTAKGRQLNRRVEITLNEKKAG